MSVEAETTWWAVEGEVVGWLARPEGETDCSLAVVRVKAVNSGPDGAPARLPAFLLRWVHHDLSVVRQGGERGEEDGVAVGDTIAFSTSREEQLAYAETT